MLKAGAAATVITNKIGSTIQGATVGGVAKYIRDELEASAMYLANDGDPGVLLISCDLGGLEPTMTDATTAAISERTGLPADRVVIGATHTGGPSVIPTNYLKPVDEAYLTELRGKLVELADRAMSQAVEAELAIGRGQAAIGYNRRSCRLDGTHAMQGARPEEFTGTEGPEDPDHLAIFARDMQGQLIGLLHQCTAHPCTFYGADFYSADYPGYGRKLLRDALGGELPVLFFNGALGDQGQEKRSDPRVPEGKEAKLIRCGATIAAETLRLLHEADFLSDVPVRHAYERCDVEVLLPSAERLESAAAVLARVDAGEKVPPFEIVSAHGATLLQKRFGDSPREGLPLHVVQIGDSAIVTQPTELFCRFGLEIKRRSPFGITSVFGITDGYRGYCPTYEAVLGGGYSAEPIYWTRFASDTGYRIVDTASAMLKRLHMAQP